MQTYNTTTKEWQKEELKQLIDDPFFNPEGKEKLEDIYEMWLYPNDIMVAGLNSPIYFQGKYFCHFFTNLMSLDRIKFEKQFCDARIYLNIKFENRLELAEKLIDNALEMNLPLTFKFATSVARNDNFVLYDQYENMMGLIGLIEKTKNENPSLFVGCKVKNPLFATLNGYMGFGEEPYWDSYTSVRVEALEKAYAELSKHYKKDKNYLTKENIKKAFYEACRKNHINSNNLCFNIPKDEKIEEL